MFDFYIFVEWCFIKLHQNLTRVNLNFYLIFDNNQSFFASKGLSAIILTHKEIKADDSVFNKNFWILEWSWPYLVIHVYAPYKNHFSCQDSSELHAKKVFQILIYWQNIMQCHIVYAQIMKLCLFTKKELIIKS